MFNENLKTLRKSKGMSQEVLAQQLNVVRQTISKWEKGLSVPDADMLMKIAELFEVSESELLGSKIQTDMNQNEIVVQLALLNEQIAMERKNRRKLYKWLKIIGITFLIILCLTGIYAFFSRLTTVTLECSLDGEAYTYTVTYWPDSSIFHESSDEYIDENVLRNQTDKKFAEKITIIEDYFMNHKGSVISTTKGFFTNGDTWKLLYDQNGMTMLEY